MVEQLGVFVFETIFAGEERGCFGAEEKNRDISSLSVLDHLRMSVRMVIQVFEHLRREQVGLVEQIQILFSLSPYGEVFTPTFLAPGLQIAIVPCLFAYYTTSVSDGVATITRCRKGMTG